MHGDRYEGRHICMLRAPNGVCSMPPSLLHMISMFVSCLFWWYFFLSKYLRILHPALLPTLFLYSYFLLPTYFLFTNLVSFVLSRAAWKHHARVLALLSASLIG